MIANGDQLPAWDIAEMWLLRRGGVVCGAHGGANDQTTILRNDANYVLYNRHSRKPLDSTPLPLLKGVRMSSWQTRCGR